LFGEDSKVYIVRCHILSLAICLKADLLYACKTQIHKGKKHAMCQSPSTTQKRYGKFTPKALIARGTNGVPFRVKAAKSPASNASAGTSTGKKDQYWLVCQKQPSEPEKCHCVCDRFTQGHSAFSLFSSVLSRVFSCANWNSFLK
jgi:hypothetical protein